jgi:hypothetical protein
MKATPARSGSARVAQVKLDQIRLDAGTQTRAHIDELVVSDYAWRW